MKATVSVGRDGVSLSASEMETYQERQIRPACERQIILSLRETETACLYGRGMETVCLLERRLYMYEMDEGSLIYIHMYSYEHDVSPTWRRPARRPTLEMALHHL